MIKSNRLTLQTIVNSLFCFKKTFIIVDDPYHYHLGADDIIYPMAICHVALPGCEQVITLVVCFVMLFFLTLSVGRMCSP